MALESELTLDMDRRCSLRSKGLKDMLRSWRKLSIARSVSWKAQELNDATGCGEIAGYGAR